MVGDAIPGTLNEDGTWDFTSKAADMIYDDVEQCYTTTVVTKVGDGEKHFRFVGNHDPKINWFEDTDGTEPDKMAKTPLTNPAAPGHYADASDPNKVNYTKKVNSAMVNIISSGTALLVDGPCVFTSIPVMLMVKMLLTTIIPLLQIMIGAARFRRCSV